MCVIIYCFTDDAVAANHQCHIVITTQFVSYFFRSKASVCWASNKLSDFSPWASSATEAAKKTKFGTKVA